MPEVSGTVIIRFSEVDLSKTEKVWQAYSGIIAVWSFGSAQNGKIVFGGDLDIAVLFADPP